MSTTDEEAEREWRRRFDASLEHWKWKLTHVNSTDELKEELVHGEEVASSYLEIREGTSAHDFGRQLHKLVEHHRAMLASKEREAQDPLIECPGCRGRGGGRGPGGGYRWQGFLICPKCGGRGQIRRSEASW